MAYAQILDFANTSRGFCRTGQSRLWPWGALPRHSPGLARQLRRNPQRHARQCHEHIVYEVPAQVPLLHRQREERIRKCGPDGAEEAHGELANMNISPGIWPRMSSC
jgi:hypothetical protein